MKKILLTSLFFIAVIVCGKTQENATSTEQKVKQTVADMFQALADQDIEKIKTYCTTDIMIVEDGAIWNIDTLIQKISQNKSADFKRINTFDFIDTQVKDNIAWTTYNNHADITANGSGFMIKWIETAILIKESKEWKIRVLHVTLKERIKK